MKKVYLSGQINRANPRTIQRSREELNLISRRIILGNALPIAPALWYLGYEKDPRLAKDPKWWVEEVFFHLMKTCDCFCYKPTTVGVFDTIAKLEKEMWEKHFKSKPMVSSDIILDFLLSWKAEEVFGELR